MIHDRARCPDPWNLFDHAVKCFNEGRFATAGRADDRSYFVFLDVQADIDQGLLISIP